METDIQEQIEAIAAYLETLRQERAKIDAEIDIEEREMKRLKNIISRTLYGVGRGDSLVITEAAYKELLSRGPLGNFGSEWSPGNVAIARSDGADGTYSVWCNGHMTVIDAEYVKEMRKEFLNLFGE